MEITRYTGYSVSGLPRLPTFTLPTSATPSSPANRKLRMLNRKLKAIQHRCVNFWSSAYRGYAALCTLLLATASVFVLTGAVDKESATVDLGLSIVEPSTFRREIERHGILEPYKSTVVHSDCYWSTNILSIVPEGTWVQEGDVVCVMDSSDIEDYARSREVLLIKYRGRLDSALHDQEMLASQSDRLLSAAQYKYETAQQEVDEYQGGTLPQQLEEMERNLSILAEQSQAAADEVRQKERLWAMGFINGQEMTQDSLKFMEVQQKRDELDSRLNLLIDFTEPRTNCKLEFTRDNALRNVARTRIRNSLAETKALLTTLSYERTMKIYERYHKRAVDSIAACTMRAPCDGQVMHGNSWYLKSRGITRIEEGAKVRRQQKVFEIPDQNRIKVSVPIDEASIYCVENGMRVTVIPAGFEETEIEGRVISIAKYPRVRSRYTPSVKDYWLDIEVLPTDEQAEILKLKADVNVRIALSENPDAIQIQRDAVTGIAGRNFVYVFDGVELVPRAIELGEANDEFVCVVDGLSPGEQLVTEMTSQHREQLEETLAYELAGESP